MYISPNIPNFDRFFSPEQWQIITKAATDEAEAGPGSERRGEWEDGLPECGDKETQPWKANEEDEEGCLVCMEGAAEAVVLECGHG